MTRNQAWKVGLIGAAIAVAGMGATYGIGRWQGRAATRRAEQKLEEAQQQLRRLDRLEARRHLDLCLSALDDRNFGIAQEHLSAAARLLARSEPAPDSDLEALTEELRATSIVAAADFGEQRREVQKFIARFDRLEPPEDPAKAKDSSGEVGK